MYFLARGLQAPCRGRPDCNEIVMVARSNRIVSRQNGSSLFTGLRDDLKLELQDLPQTGHR
jgi:hypothetical protein